MTFFLLTVFSWCKKKPWSALLLRFYKLKLEELISFHFHTRSHRRNFGLFNLCHLNNSDWQGKVVTSTYHWLTWQFSFLQSLNFNSSQWPVCSERTIQVKCVTSSHLNLLTKQLRESNVLPSPVFSTMFAALSHLSLLSNSFANGVSPT